MLPRQLLDQRGKRLLDGVEIGELDETPAAEFPEIVTSGTQFESTGLGSALLRHVFADMLPQIAEDRHIGVDRIVGYRHARQLDDAAPDRVGQHEVRHHSGEEQRAFLVAQTAREKRGRREIGRPR
jgi:hypothetical protein